MMMNDTRVISEKEQIDYYDRIKDENPPRHLIYTYDDEPVGFISDDLLDEEKGYMDGGYYLGERGLPLQASMGLVFCSLDYAFDTLEAKKICGTVRKTNEGSILLDKRCGYTISEKPKDDPLSEEFYDAIIDLETWNKVRERIKKGIS